jgi:hypothetical protein
MGNAHDWIRVLGVGAIFGALMVLISWGNLPRSVRPTRSYLSELVRYWLFAGLGFGVADTFGIRLLRVPLVFLSAVLIVILFLLGLSLRRSKKQLINQTMGR